VFADDLYQLLETRSPDEITDEMIQGAWDVAEFLFLSVVQSGTGVTKELDMPKDKEYQKFLKRVVAVLGDETVQAVNS
jgi:hypothetical protein